eukprot:comp20942_c1_seq1/m.27989 comp20942_c1_seq1/g.27989  ORF comp20942_c1_seq1/g.27989 comp20942_c1_seq1/m.27989 type:complete len:455 (-) comp20942_c1_seq1:446-1810(-)
MLASLLTLLGAASLCHAGVVKLTSATEAPRLRHPLPPAGYVAANNQGVPPGTCDNVNSVAGYFPVGQDKNYFYWIFESRGNYTTSPVVLWMTGGPGCSSELALFHENGPCKINDDHKTTRPNHWSWNQEASVIYIDQPAGVGFSTGPVNDTGERDVAKEMHTFLEHFFAANPEIADNEFYITGESYGGHYVPAVAAKILKENQKGAVKINLKGVGIGNGLTNPLIQFDKYADYARDNPVRPLVTDKEYKHMKKEFPKCAKLMQKCQRHREHEAECQQAQSFCNQLLMAPIQSRGLNVYDIRRIGNYEADDIVEYLSQKSIKQILGVGDNVEWQLCSPIVGRHFTRDIQKDFSYDVIRLLKAGVRVLIYAGDDDYICNYIGNKAWLMDLDWHGKRQFVKAHDKPWMVAGMQAGLVRSHENLIWLQVHDSGHMVPMDQPQRAQVMINLFLKNHKFA